MSRLTPCFDALRSSGRKAVIPYIVAGDPTVASTVPMLHRLVAAGADVLELGVPFSDPMSEGPVIQRGHERALANSVSLTQVLAMVVEFRQQDQTTPVVIMGYANPVERMGYAQFLAGATRVYTWQFWCQGHQWGRVCAGARICSPSIFVPANHIGVSGTFIVLITVLREICSVARSGRPA